MIKAHFPTRIILSLCCAVMSYSLAVAQYIEFKPKPDWVQAISLETPSEVSKYDVNGGAYASLIDKQSHMGKEADFVHLQLKAQTDAGISLVSELSLNYDTVYQHAEFHYLCVWRDGERMDRTADISFEQLRQEQQLNINIYSGQVTSYCILDDIRKGDIVEYAYTIYGDNPVFAQKPYRMYDMETFNPIDRHYVRAIFPSGYSYDCVDCDDYNYTVTVDGDETVIILDAINIKADVYEETAPTWDLSYPYLIISASEDWQAVGDWAQGVFDLPKESYKDVLSSITKSGQSKQEQIDAVINFVQDDIRYMGLENGLGSIQPFHPREVLDQRFGDCKDKSLLLSVLLREMGLKVASPALVSTYFQSGLDDLVPGPQLFDHCIAYFEFQGESYWVDPTRSLQGGGYETFANMDFQRALIVDQAEKGLVAMETNELLSMTRVTEKYEAGSFTDPCILTVSNYFSGMDADAVRSILESVSIRELETGLMGQYSRLYPRISIEESLQIEDDEENNIITIIETYGIRDIWQSRERDGVSVLLLHYEPLKLYDYVTSLTCDQKEKPVYVNFPSRFQQQTTIIIPDILMAEAGSFERVNPGFSFNHEHLLLNETTLGMRYEFQTLTREVSAQAYQQVCEDMNRIVTELPYEIFFDKKGVESHFPTPYLMPDE